MWCERRYFGVGRGGRREKKGRLREGKREAEEEGRAGRRAGHINDFTNFF
jgi:hypothetical protein